MAQYVDYMKKAIIDEIQNNTDVETIQLIYGFLMTSSSEQATEKLKDCPQRTHLQ